MWDKFKLSDIAITLCILISSTFVSIRKSRVSRLFPNRFVESRGRRKMRQSLIFFKGPVFIQHTIGLTKDSSRLWLAIAIAIFFLLAFLFFPCLLKCCYIALQPQNLTNSSIAMLWYCNLNHALTKTTASECFYLWFNNV